MTHSANNSVDSVDDIDNEWVKQFCGCVRWRCQRMSHNISPSLWPALFFIIIVAKEFFWAIACLRTFCQICIFLAICCESDGPVLLSLDFATVVFFYRARSSPLHPTPNLEDQVPVFMPASDRVAHLYPQAQCSLFITFYDSQGYGGGTVTCVLTRGLSRLPDINHHDLYF
jgi:hypothetical protein